MRNTNNVNDLKTRVFHTEHQAESFYEKLAQRQDVGRMHLTKRQFDTIMREQITYWEVSYTVYGQMGAIK